MFGLNKDAEKPRDSAIGVTAAVAPTPVPQEPTAAEPAPVAPDWDSINSALQLLVQGQWAEAAEAADSLPEPVRDPFRELVVCLNQRFTEVLKAASTAVEYGARPLLASEQLVGATKTQATQVNQVAALSEELAASVEQVAASSDAAVSNANAAMKQVEAGVAHVRGALDGMGIIEAGMNNLQQNVAQLLSTVEPIHQVLELIEDISGQTNLLALNAAIEAARAGDQGRGFAVVAQEVRRLAERSHRAVQDVKDQITTLRQGANAVSSATNQLASQVSENIQLAGKGQAALQTIRSSLEESTAPMKEIAKAAEEESQAVQEAAASTTQIATAMDDVQRAASDLAVMVSDLQRALSTTRALGEKFKLKLSDKDLLVIARADHVLWVQRLHEMMLGRERIDMSSLTDHLHCRLGRWYESHRRQGSAIHAFRALEQPHQEMHATARRAVELYNSGRKEEAAEAVHKVVTLSQEILSLLSECQQDWPEG